MTSKILDEIIGHLNSLVFSESQPYGSNESDLLTFVTDFCTLVSCDHSMVVTSMTSIIDQYSPVA